MKVAERRQGVEVVVEAALVDGRGDAAVAVLGGHGVSLDEGEIWASTGSTVKFGWEIAKANLNPEKMPDVGVHRHVRFA